MRKHEKLFKRGSIYFARVRQPDGTIRRISTGCIDYRAAEACAKELERIAHGTADTPSDTPPHSVGLAVGYLIAHGGTAVAEGTLNMYRTKGGHLVRLLGPLDVNRLHLDDVQGYITQRLAEGAGRETLRKELSTLRVALTVAHSRKLLLTDPRLLFPRFRTRYVPRKTHLTLDQFCALMLQLEPLRQLWVTLATFTGGRDSEVDGLTWEDLDWTAMTAHIRGTKTAKARRDIPIVPALEAVLRPLKDGATGLIVGDWPNIRRDLGVACRRAGVPRVTPNDLRRTFASWLKQAQVDSYVVAQLLGHTTARMVELVYGRLTAGTLQEAMRSLPPSASARGSVAGRLIAPALSPASAESILSSGETPELAGASRDSEVLGAGIEPATRGFSVLSSDSINTEHHEDKRKCGT